MRRVEQAHKEQLANVHKQSLHLLRAINRFKGSVVQILERENLQAAAHDVKCVPDLPTEEVSLWLSLKYDVAVSFWCNNDIILLCALSNVSYYDCKIVIFGG